MNWDIVKGVLIVLVAISAVVTAFVLISASGPDKAGCIARALKSGIPVGNIERVCRLLDK
ncbi:hypothetical protein JAB5_26110 [Janthinobacterium sp. HH103]|uniref:hypothetical protein n=1 Tax=unclassified Janthinobacterium TaxID=2610881 RepID=UPI00087497E7|nr:MULTISPECIES: hypothetical protein [unclassified Janthinobacterium]OEZ58217.1 hypothetical protein JAB2_49410 [Janthinobacterium sp. HH100]OEZ77151.1 hypothetical protein JAB5_26110 [Janthinobacterium sp. HH103]OEZ88075.1 hypothetical protein JAB8_30290 [Janthinobacterium sp. HH106]QOU75630.1 hypothetical protein JAB4_051180 [Janthinobacterium sp. HH102]